jgi:hypothetical protein
MVAHQVNTKNDLLRSASARQNRELYSTARVDFGRVGSADLYRLRKNWRVVVIK